jgi:hypothetical protein
MKERRRLRILQVSFLLGLLLSLFFASPFSERCEQNAFYEWTEEENIIKTSERIF